MYSDAGISTLASLPVMKNVEELNLGGCVNGGVLASIFAQQMSVFSRLTRLILSLVGGDITLPDILALTRSPLASSLEEVHLTLENLNIRSTRHLNDSCAKAIAQSPYLGRLKKMTLEGAYLSVSGGILPILSSSKLPSLASIHFRSNEDEGYYELDESLAVEEAADQMLLCFETTATSLQRLYLPLTAYCDLLRTLLVSRGCRVSIL